MKTVLTSLIISAILVAMIVISVRVYTSIPVAIFSHSTGQCVRLIQDGDIKTPCGRLPERYHMEWMQ